MTRKRVEAVIWGLATWAMGVGLVAAFGTTSRPALVAVAAVLATIPGMAIATRIHLRDVRREDRPGAGGEFGALFVSVHLALDALFWAVLFDRGLPETTEPVRRAMTIGISLLYLEMLAVPRWVGRRS